MTCNLWTRLFVKVLKIFLAITFSVGLLTSCQKKSGPSSSVGGGGGGNTSEGEIEYEVSGTIAEEGPVEFVQSIDSVEISGVNLASSTQYQIKAFYLSPSGKKVLIHESVSNSNRFDFKAKVPKHLIIIEAVRIGDGGKFAGLLPPPMRKLLAKLRMNRTTTIAAKMAGIIGDKASSGDAGAQAALTTNSISVADVLMVAQSVRLAVDEQKNQNVGSSIDLNGPALKLLEKSNERLSALIAEGQKPEAVAEKLSEKTYATVFGDKAEEISPAILAHRTNHDLGSSSAASKDVAYETIKSLQSASAKQLDEAFRVEADAYRKAADLAGAVIAESTVSSVYARKFTACKNGEASCAAAVYVPPPPPITLDGGGTVDDSDPTVVITSNLDSTLTNNASIILTFTFSEAVTGFTASDVMLTNATAGLFTEISSTVYTLSITATGSNVTANVAAKAAGDVAGNGNAASSQWSISYDFTPPNPPVVSGTTPTSSVTPTWTWMSGGGGNGTYRYKLNSTDLTTGATETTGAAFTSASALTEGAHTLYVQERDAAGNWSTSGSHPIVIDTTAPTLTINDASASLITPANQASYAGVNGSCSSTDGSVTVSFTKTPSAPVIVTATCTGGSWSAGATNLSPFSDGTVAITAMQTDNAANSTSVSTTTTKDTAAPNAPTVSGTTPTSSVTPTWTWTNGGGGNGTYRYKLNSTDLTTGATETTGAAFTPASALTEGTQTLYVQERDAAGNWSASGSYAIEVLTPPVAPSLSIATRNVSSLGLSWASVAGATSYNLYWSATPGVTTSSTKISGVTSVYTHSSLNGGAPYYYKLAAVKNGVEGAMSNEVSGTPFVGQAAAPIMSPAAGTYASTQTVTLTSSTNGAAIYYRLDGVAASCSSGTPYTGSIAVTSTTTISSIACAADHQDSTLSSGIFTIEAVTADNGYGRFFGWGFNSDGRLGNGTTSAITSPSQIGSDSDWNALVHSMYHSAGIRLGKLYTWGRNVEGQLGNGTTTNSLSPIEIFSPSEVQANTDNRWTHVSVGWYHTVAIRGGKLYAWGENVCGQLGDGTTTRRNMPVQIGTDTDWTHVSAGGHVTVGIRGGKLYGWGDTTNGVIGNNATAANCIL